MTDREVMQQARDALETFQKISDFTPAQAVHAITALRERLAQQQESDAFDTLPDDYETGDY